MIELSSAANKFVAAINKSPKLFNTTPKEVFQPSVNWPFLNSEVKKPFVVYTCRPGLQGVDFHIDRSQHLGLGYLHFLNSSTIHVGYVFELDYTLETDYNTNYFLTRKSSVSFDNKVNPEVPLTNQHMTVYTYAEELVLAVRKKFVYPIFKP
jgi:hypothetical protein